MRNFRRIEEDELLRLQRRKQNEKSVAALDKLEHESSNLTQNAQALHLERARSQSQVKESFTAFRSMTRMELEWVSAWYEQFMRHQQLHLWKRFESLSLGQKRAVLLDISQLHQHPVSEGTQPNWDDWKQRLSLVEEVPLEDEETLQEKRLGEETVKTSFYMMKQSELLSPYREIIWWLCYKGNHQAQQALLNKIDQLGIDAKKLLILRLNGAQKCTSLNFSQQLTIIQHQQTVVNWERIREQLHFIEQLDNEQVQQELGEHESSFQSQQRSDGISSSMKPSSTSYDDENEDSQEYELNEGQRDEDEIKELEANEQRSDLAALAIEDLTLNNKDHRATLLELLDSIALTSVIVKMLLQKGQAKMNKLDFIDLCLRVPLNWSPKQRLKAREKQMKQYAFTSLQQLFEFLINTLSNKIFIHGLQKHEPTYVELLKVLKLLNTAAIPTEESIKQHLILQIEQ